MIIQVSAYRQNTGNWEYTIKDREEYINTRFIKRISPVKGAFAVYLEGDDVQYPSIYIDQNDLNGILAVKRSDV